QAVTVDTPRSAIVVFRGVSASGKSSLAFGTLYAEAQRRDLESVAPYAPRLVYQIGGPQGGGHGGLAAAGAAAVPHTRRALRPAPVSPDGCAAVGRHRRAAAGGGAAAAAGVADDAVVG